MLHFQCLHICVCKTGYAFMLTVVQPHSGLLLWLTVDITLLLMLSVIIFVVFIWTVWYYVCAGCYCWVCLCDNLKRAMNGSISVIFLSPVRRCLLWSFCTIFYFWVVVCVPEYEQGKTFDIISIQYKGLSLILSLTGLLKFETNCVFKTCQKMYANTYTCRTFHIHTNTHMYVRMCAHIHTASI